MAKHVSVMCPFLYPSFFIPRSSYRHVEWLASRSRKQLRVFPTRGLSTEATEPSTFEAPAHPSTSDHQDIPASQKYTNPSPDDYSTTPFVDACSITISSGHGGNGCVAFLREKYVIDGPPNGGDGGTGGNIFIRAVQGHTSLHKLARQGTFRAGRGRGGMGKNQGGRRGEDVVIEVPIGTVVKEVERWDFASDEEREANSRPENLGNQARKLVFYPGGGRDEQRRMQRQMERDGLQMPDFGIRRNPMKSMEPALPIRLDLDAHMSQPMLLAAGGIGGLGNPHFSTAEVTRPKIASRGQMGVKVRLELELKLLADVGLVGLPNAGKSTLLRSITNSRTRVGNWAFTTLEPKIGTVILDDHKGRPRVRSLLPTGETRTNFTIADIPGLVEGAHLDRGLGLGFLRHIERARILCFVIDLSAGDAVLALQNLWNELGQYEALRNEQLNLDTEKRFSEHDSLDNPFASIGGTIISPPSSSLRPSEAPSPPATTLPPLRHSPISSKPWFIVATKADLPSTQSNFLSLKTSLQKIQAGEEPHPSGKPNTWSPQQNGDPVECLPVSAMKGEGVENVVGIVTGILDRL